MAAIWQGWEQFGRGGSNLAGVGSNLAGVGAIWQGLGAIWQGWEQFGQDLLDFQSLICFLYLPTPTLTTTAKKTHLNN